DAAENLTQDCFIRAFRALERFRGDASISTWLLQIAANLIRNHAASSRLKFWRRLVRPESDWAELRDWVPDAQLSPEAQTLVREQVQAIWKAAARLPGRQRTVFLLRFVEDMDLLEIAAVTRMKEGTVKTHLFRALQAVRSALSKENR